MRDLSWTDWIRETWYASEVLRKGRRYNDRIKLSEGNINHHLLCSHAHSLDGELATAHIKQVFKIGSQEIDCEDVMQALLAEVMDLRNTDCESG
jgi:hypothetical protein